MNLWNLFQSFENKSPAAVKQYISEHKPAEYQLLDVRQPREFDLQHLPGAILIPVGDLADRLTELDTHKPTFVYCRSGMRSRAAAGLLHSKGFDNIYNMVGGLIAYDGGKAVGSEGFGMEHFVGSTFDDVFRMSYAMEEGLQQLYLALEEVAVETKVKELLQRLARFEDGHKAKLLAVFPGVDVEKQNDIQSLEGGFDKQHFLDRFRTGPPDLREIIELGMMVETQALDLYTRLSRIAEDEKSQSLFAFLAREEKMHLNFLSSEMDSI